MKKILYISIFTLGILTHTFAQPTDPGPDNTLDFDGTDDFINLGTHTDFTNLSQGDFTIEAWVKTSGNSSQAIVSNYQFSPAYALSINSNNLAFHIESSLYTSTTTVNDGEWHHVVVIRDFGDALLMYVDGIQIYSYGSDPSSSFQVPRDMWIGTHPYGGQAFEGNVEEVRIWNTVRTEAQIRENMYNVLEGNETGLIAYYGFDEASGTSLPDETSNGYDGTLNNMTDADWVASNAFNTWLGGTSSSWATASNWSLGAVPTGENIGIYNFATGSDPTISGSPSIDKLYIGSGVSMTVSSDFSVSGDAFINSSLSLPSSSGTTSIVGDLYLGSGSTLSLQAGSKLTTTGMVNNSGTVSILSPSNNGITGSLITNGGINNSGTMNAQRWISQGDTTAVPADYTWHSLSIPIATTTAGSVYAWDYTLNYIESDNSWINLEHFSNPIDRGKGYLVKTIDSPKTILFSGTLNTGSYGYTLNNTGSDATHGYNLVGNPYPSSINLETISRTNIGSTVWVWDPATENYLTHTIGGGASTLGQYIMPFQAFFIKVNAGSASGNVTFNNSDRTHSSGGTFYKKSESTDFEDLVLKVKGNDRYDILYIKHRDAMNDAFKFFSMNPAVPMLYVKEFGSDYAIYNLPGNPENQRIQLGFYAGPSGDYSFEVMEESFTNYDVFLLDNLSENSTQLEPGNTIDFSYESNINEERFEILFSPKSTLSIENQDAGFVNIFSNDMSILVWKNGFETAEIDIYDINGRLITSEISDTDKFSINVSVPGIYLVRVVSEGKLSVKKISVF